MAKLAPLKTIEFDPMAWRTITAPPRAANDEQPGTRRGRLPPGAWVALIATACLALVYHLAAR